MNGNYKEIVAVAAKLNQLKVNDEISFTEDVFESKELYDSVINGIKAAGFACTLNCGVHRWFSNKDDARTLIGDFRKDVIILRRTNNYEMA